MFRELLQYIKSLRKIHLAVVFVEYDRQGRLGGDRAFAVLQQYLAPLAGCRLTYLRVDNADESKPFTRIGKDTFLVGGDNRSHEFSGWQRGLDVLASQRCPYDLVLIVNDMFLKPGPSFLQDYASLDLLQKSLVGKKIIGRIDTVGQEYALFGFDVSSWICTNCFVVPKDAVRDIGSLVSMEGRSHEIFPQAYDPRHLLQRGHLVLDSGTGNFSLECDLPAGQRQELRIQLTGGGVDQVLRPLDDGCPRIAIINEISGNNQPLAEDRFVRGLSRDRQNLWAAQSFLLSLPQEDTPPTRLLIKGCLPPETRQKIITNELELLVYNDARLFQENAPITLNYQRWIVEWLTERWHSRFQIDQSSWAQFKSKACAIFNEALLTARFRELGYPAETYGEKIYY